MQDSVKLLLLLCLVSMFGYIFNGPKQEISNRGNNRMMEGFAPLEGGPTLEPSQSPSPANSTEYSGCLADGYTREYCQQQISADSCLCSNGMTGKRLPGYRGACVCDPQEIEKYQQENTPHENSNTICLTPNELGQVYSLKEEAPRQVLDKIREQLPFNPKPYHHRVLNAMF